MWRKGIQLLLAATLFVSAMPAVASAAIKVETAQIVASVSFRTGPSTTNAVTRYLKAGEEVVVLERTNASWLRVQDVFGKIGYISSSDKYVDYSPQAQGPTGANAIVVSSVSFRQAPSTDGAFIRYLKKDEPIAITGVVNNYWYAIKDSAGATGYVSSQAQYVKVTGSLPQTSAPSTGGQTGGQTGQTASQKIESVIAAGQKYLGTPYEFGSDRNTTKTFDCSDFVRQAFKDALGVTLPAASASQGDYVRGKNAVTTDWHALKRGDLMFFMNYKGTKASLYDGKRPFVENISHVGIYLGNGQVLHTYSVASGGVRVDSISGKHWEYRFLFGGSAL
ncbi:SH3 domain-containing protein [Cohnella suwonensis]|uniref:SH3 domain-containing protein n=1 Tax=Cohnella suwonensis TaxID=696072 RepID=A0ABW0LZL5_9BACL